MKSFFTELEINFNLIWWRECQNICSDKESNGCNKSIGQWHGLDLLMTYILKKNVIELPKVGSFLQGQNNQIMLSEFRIFYGKILLKSVQNGKYNTVKFYIAYRVSVWYLSWIPGDKSKEFVWKNWQVWQNSDIKT